MNTKTKSFVYLRRSQDRYDRQVLSIEGQQKAIAQTIKHHNVAPILLPPEEQTASAPGRPVFNDMMTRIEAGEARHIVTWAANRLSRNYIDGGRILQALHTGVLLSIITPSKVYLPTIQDMLMLHIELGMAKMYSDEISQNVKRGNQAKYERGEYPTHAPIGYLNTTIGQNKNIVPDPERAPKIQALFRLASTGKYTFDELYKYAINVERLTSKKGNPIPKQTLFDLLQKSVYYGVYQHGGDWHHGKYEKLITIELFDQVQAAMGWRRKRVRNATSGTFYPYKGLVVCKYCGHNLTAYTKPKKLAKGSMAYYTYYVCTRKSKKVQCREPQITADDLEQQLIELIKPIRLNSDDAEQCKRLLQGFHRELTENRAHRLSDWREEQKQVEKRLARLLELRIDDELTHDEFRTEKKTLNDRLVRTKEQIDEAHTNADAWLELAENFFSSAVTLNETFNVATEEEKREILKEVGLNWKLSNKKVQFTPRKPYDLLVNRTDSSNWRARPDLNRRSPP